VDVLVEIRGGELEERAGDSSDLCEVCTAAKSKDAVLEFEGEVEEGEAGGRRHLGLSLENRTGRGAGRLWEEGEGSERLSSFSSSTK